ncbi:amidase domain-containing protein [Paenibacillus sp. FSL L8-0502]|uniref:amidase domain-containing protein n=1 Tax=Paenibacillus sp. FSL L8-0502 TaxID=2954619 RepID=UPI0031580516
MLKIAKLQLLCMILIMIPAYSFSSFRVQAEPAKQDDVIPFLQKLFNDRTRLLMDQDKKHIEDYYLVKHNRSNYAYLHEMNRAEYIQEWAKHRKMKFVNAESSIRISRIEVLGDTAKVSLVQSLKLSYEYIDSYPGQHDFGIGTRHGITLRKKDSRWYVEREWYSDPLEENPKKIEPLDSSFIPHKDSVPSEKVIHNYNRARAIDYANKYAGITWGAGNRQRYNPKYLDYNSKGGDCTNFSSQVIGDKEEGGGLPMKSGWHYLYGNGGSQAWVQTDAFKNFLIRSGYGRIIGQGSFSDVVRAINGQQHQYRPQLLPGDLIAYVLKGDVDHFSVVVGFDEGGYPLVNSHTADRFRVPFDLGWDRNTQYLLIHIQD